MDSTAEFGHGVTANRVDGWRKIPGDRNPAHEAVRAKQIASVRSDIVPAALDGGHALDGVHV